MKRSSECAAADGGLGACHFLEAIAARPVDCRGALVTRLINAILPAPAAPVSVLSA